MRWMRFQAHSNLRITTLRRVVSQWALPRWLPVQSAIADGATLGTLLERLPNGAAGKASIAPWQRIGFPVNAARCHDSMRLRDQSLHFTRPRPGAETCAMVAPGRRQSVPSGGAVPMPSRDFSVSRFFMASACSAACLASFSRSISFTASMFACDVVMSACTSILSRHRRG